MAASVKGMWLFTYFEQEFHLILNLKTRQVQFWRMYYFFFFQTFTISFFYQYEKPTLAKKMKKKHRSLTIVVKIFEEKTENITKERLFREKKGDPLERNKEANLEAVRRRVESL